MKGGQGRSAWPNHLHLVAREGEDQEHSGLVASAKADLLNSRSAYSPSSPRLDQLADFRLTSNIPSADAVRELEDLLESGEQNEGPFQRLVERHPQLLSSLVIGNWDTYVIPKKRLGNQHETDFLVLGVSSLGPQWVAVELEAPRHELLTRQGRIRSEVQHAVDQIQDWRDWLAKNVSYAHETLHLHGITSRLPGLVVVGRDEPRADREPARSRIFEQQAIQIHSWDWMLRETKRGINDRILHGATPVADLPLGGVEW